MYNSARLTYNFKVMTSHPFRLAAALATLVGSVHAADPAPAAKAEDIPKVGLVFWISADHVEQADGAVAVLQDRSGKDNHARPKRGPGIVPTNPIVVKDAASAQSVLRFSGENCCFSFNQLSDILTGFCVVSKDPTAFGTRNELCVFGAKDSNDLHTGWKDDVIYNETVERVHLSKMAADGKQWLNGHPIKAQKTPWPQQLGVFSFTTAGPVRVGQIGRDRNMASRTWKGEIAEILLYNTVLSDADRVAVEKYLLAKYAIKPELPAPAK